MADMNGLAELKVTMIGSGGVGKSALTLRFVTNEFPEEYDPTIEDSYRKTFILDEQSVQLDVCDTAGQEDFSNLQDNWIRDGAGFVMVYSIESKATFDDLVPKRARIHRVKDNENIPLVVVGNKCYLPMGLREVSQEEGQALADSWGCPFFETSAKNKTNLEEMYHALVRMCVQRGLATFSKKEIVRDPVTGQKKRRFCAVL